MCVCARARACMHVEGEGEGGWVYSCRGHNLLTQHVIVSILLQSQFNAEDNQAELNALREDLKSLRQLITEIED